MTVPVISHDRAMKAAQRFINYFFNREGEKPQAQIPARIDEDDDLVLCQYIRQQELCSLLIVWNPIDQPLPKGPGHVLVAYDDGTVIPWNLEIQHTFPPYQKSPQGHGVAYKWAEWPKAPKVTA